MLFCPGQLVATPGAISFLGSKTVTPLALVARHVHGDWGNLSADDRKANDEAILNGSRIFSAYLITGIKLYVITESDRSYTTVLLASEY